MQYGTVLADPPWDYTELGFHGYKGVKNYDVDSGTQYPTLKVEQIKKLEVVNIVAPQAHLYLWVTKDFMEYGFDIVRNWGFEFRGILTWVKKPRMGMGHYFRHCTEFVLFGVRGKLGLCYHDERDYFEAPINKHSEKPEILYDIIERNSPRPWIELFARKRKPGWDTWGNEVESIIKL